MNKRLKEILSRLKEINDAIETADGEALTALEQEARELLEERQKIEEEIAKRKKLREDIAGGAIIGESMEGGITPIGDQTEERANAFVQSRSLMMSAAETRSVLVSSGQLATPTGVSGINDIEGANSSSIIDLVTVENCEGMSSNKVAYVSSDSDAAADQTEGSPATGREATFGYVTITPESVAVTSQISKQAKKQTPLNYTAKVTAQAKLALRKAAISKIVTKLKASALVNTVTASVASSKGKIDEKSLRNLVFAYGGDEGISGGAVLFLNKNDLIAFGDVRGANEKKAVYDIVPDGQNPNMGTIKDGGLTVRYCIVSGLTACHNTAQGSAAIKTMFYGNPKNFELDLFSDYEIKVSEDFAFTLLMDTIRGDVELGGDVVVKNGFIALTIPATA